MVSGENRRIRFSLSLLYLPLCLVPVGAQIFNKEAHNIINSQSAWNQNITGSGVSIGIVDTPVKTDNKILQGKIHLFLQIVLWLAKNVIHMVRMSLVLL